MSQEDLNEIRLKINEIVASLAYLHNKFDLQYFLGCLKIENLLYVVNEAHFNTTINAPELEYIVHQLSQVQKKLKYTNSLVSNGRMVVACVNDEQKAESFRGEWVKKGEIYVVTMMRRLSPIGFFYELDDMPNNSLGYHSSRFQRISQIHIFN